MTSPRHERVASRIRHVENRHRQPGTDVYQQGNTKAGNQPNMAEVTIVYWRDIPAQVIVGKGRSGSKVQLTERFEQAIDRCAMKIGAQGRRRGRQRRTRRHRHRLCRQT